MLTCNGRSLHAYEAPAGESRATEIFGFLLPHVMHLSQLRPYASIVTALAMSIGAPGDARAQSGDTLLLSLEEAISYALRVSPEVGAERAGQDYAEARHRFALASRFFTDFTATSAHAVAPGLTIPDDNIYPNHALYLNPDVRNDWENLRPFNRLEIELTQPVYTWGELGGSIRAARRGVDVEQADVSATRLEVSLRTGELYYGLLLTQALARLAEETGSVIERAKREIDRMIEEGNEDVDYADQFKVLITEQEYRRRVVEVVRRRMTAETAMVRQLMLENGTVVRAVEPALQPVFFALDSLDHYLELGLNHRPELQKADAGVAARGALVQVARSDYFPKLFVAASARISGAEGRFRQPNPYVGDPFVGRSVRAGIGVRQRLNFMQTHARVAQAEAERNEVWHQRTAARQLVLFEVEQAYNNVVIAAAALDAQSESLRISKEWLQTESINFDLDLGDPENLVDAVQTNLEIEASYLESVSRYNVAVLRLLAASGVLADRARSGTLVD